MVYLFIDLLIDFLLIYSFYWGGVGGVCVCVCGGGGGVGEFPHFLRYNFDRVYVAYLVFTRTQSELV